jgi:hypothetical protein
MVSLYRINALKYCKLFVFLSLLAMLFVACKKGHYDVSNVHGMNAEGEMLLPIGSGSFTVSELMQQFNIDSMITCSEDGILTYGFHFEDFGVVDGDSLLRFKDLEYNERFSFENPYPIMLPQAFDTMFHFDQTLVFESDHIHVMEAEMKSGHFDFDLSSNIGLLQRLVIRSSDIKDEAGRDLVLDFDLNSSDIQFDLDGLHYETDSANSLRLGYDVYVSILSIPDQELFFEVDVKGSELAIKEMSGFVDPYESRNVLDTTLNLFPGNASGSLQVYGARMRLSERNTFDLEARLDVDTAWLFADDHVPVPIFGPQQVSVDIPSQFSFGQVYERSLNGKIMANETDLYAISNFIVNPSGMSDLVSVSDTCVIDVMIDTEIPFAFVMNDVRFVDTTDLNLNIDAPDQIEKLTLELTFTSTIPLNMNAQFFTFDSEIGQITDTLVAEDKLISASYDGKPVTTEVILEVTGKKVEHLNHSDRLISIYEIETEDQEVCLKGEQQLSVFIKARVKYNGTVDF